MLAARRLPLHPSHTRRRCEGADGCAHKAGRRFPPFCGKPEAVLSGARSNVSGLKASTTEPIAKSRHILAEWVEECCHGMVCSRSVLSEFEVEVGLQPTRPRNSASLQARLHGAGVPRHDAAHGRSTPPHNQPSYAPGVVGAPRSRESQVCRQKEPLGRGAATAEQRIPREAVGRRCTVADIVAWRILADPVHDLILVLADDAIPLPVWPICPGVPRDLEVLQGRPPWTRTRTRRKPALSCVCWAYKCRSGGS